MIKHDAAPIRSGIALLLISPVILAMAFWLVVVGLILFTQEKIENMIRRHRIKQMCK